MWVLKLKIVDENCIWAARCKKFGIYDYQYPLNYRIVDDNIVTALYHILDGESEKIKNFIRDAKRDERVRKLEIRKNLVISQAVEKRSRMLDPFYDSRLLFIRPVINYPDGSEVWEVGCFERSLLAKLLTVSESKYNGELIFFKRIKVPKIFIPQLMPELTKRQEEAFNIAISHGYYNFPRKVSLGELSKLMNVSRPTFEEHLRKAESKLLNSFKAYYSRL